MDAKTKSGSCLTKSYSPALLEPPPPHPVCDAHHPKPTLFLRRPFEQNMRKIPRQKDWDICNFFPIKHILQKWLIPLFLLNRKSQL